MISSITVAALILGLLCGAVPIMCFVAPEWTGATLRRFSRNKVAGQALVALNLLWVGWAVYHAELGTFNSYKPLVFALVPLAFGLILWAMPELLAARALGGLFLLIPTPILNAIRWEDSWVRLILAGLCYVMVIKGMTLVLSPYRLRTTVEWMLASQTRTRIVATSAILVAGAIMVLGVLIP